MDRNISRGLEAYEEGAHLALGYSSWGAYFEEEFGQSGRQGERLLDAGRVMRAIEIHSDQLVAYPTEAQARELAPIIRSDPEAGPQKAAAIWGEVVEEAEKNQAKPTAEAIRDRVRDGKSEENATVHDPRQNTQEPLCWSPGSVGRVL